MSEDESRQYLTFKLDSETFAFEINSVREVVQTSWTTKVPNTPEYMRGVINLRGSLVPVIDLKDKFQVGQTSETVDTCIVIVDVDVEGERVILGSLADSVEKVIEISPDDIEPPPMLGTTLERQFIRGMGKWGEAFVIILDVNRVFDTDEIVAARKTAVDNGIQAGDAAGKTPPAC